MPVLFSVPEGSNAGGENYERPGFKQGQRGGFQWVCCVGGSPDCCLQWLLPRAEEEKQVDICRETTVNQL